MQWGCGCKSAEERQSMVAQREGVKCTSEKRRKNICLHHDPGEKIGLCGTLQKQNFSLSVGCRVSFSVYCEIPYPRREWFEWWTNKDGYCV